MERQSRLACLWYERDMERPSKTGLACFKLEQACLTKVKVGALWVTSRAGMTGMPRKACSSQERNTERPAGRNQHVLGLIRPSKCTVCMFLACYKDMNCLGGGDPSLATADMVRLVSCLRRHLVVRVGFSTGG